MPATGKTQTIFVKNLGRKPFMKTGQFTAQKSKLKSGTFNGKKRLRSLLGPGTLNSSSGKVRKEQTNRNGELEDLGRPEVYYDMDGQEDEGIQLKIQSYSGAVSKTWAEVDTNLDEVNTENEAVDTSNIDMDKTFWNAVQNIESFSKSSSQKSESTQNDMDSQMLSLGLKRTTNENETEDKASPENTSGRRLRKRKRVDYSQLDGNSSLDVDLPLNCSEGAEQYFRMVNKNFNPRDIEVKEQIDILDKQYFPPAAIVPKGCNSRYAKGVVANTLMVTKSVSDKQGNTWVETKLAPKRKTIFQNHEGRKLPMEATSSSIVYRTKKPTIFVCHPTKPVINGPFK